MSYISEKPYKDIDEVLALDTKANKFYHYKFICKICGKEKEKSCFHNSKENALICKYCVRALSWKEKYGVENISQLKEVKEKANETRKENSRIADAIELAGGLKENADIEDINLAYVLEDGIKIYIPTKEEKNKNTTQEKQTTEYTSKSSSTTEQTQNSQASTTNANKNTNNTTNKNEKVNINTATQTELETLPGIGPSTALKIINYRKENGKFKTIDDVKKVSGIGDSKFDKIKNFIKV